MTDANRVRFHLHVAQRGHGRVLREGPRPVTALAPGRVPRIARLVALAHKFEAMLCRGEIECMADIARLGHVTRARVTQIMGLTLLAPDIQEELLHLAPVKGGHDPITLRELRYVMETPVWGQQRARWAEIAGAMPSGEALAADRL